MPRKSANREIGVPRLPSAPAGAKKIPMFIIPIKLEMTKMGIFQSAENDTGRTLA
jgi:hypothetical protein